MPQMAPVWWLTLFLMFIMTYCTFMMITYFYHIYQLSMKMSKENLTMKNISWKW